MNQAALRTSLGYLNLSSGSADPKFYAAINELFGELTAQPGDRPAWLALGDLLAIELAGLVGRAPGFESIDQAAQVLRLTFGGVLPAYRRFHRDLLAHLTDTELIQPLLIAKACQAVLEQEPPWTDEARIIDGAVNRLNTFIGHRPVAVLRTAQKIEPYAHEWVCPIPLYLAGAGVAVGRYHDLISAALDVLRSTDQEILDLAYFDLNLLTELALDPRAYDFDHPANKRPNYHFGQWDPHTIDNTGHYRRFVLQAVTLDALLERVEQGPGNQQERLREAASVLAGTMLMAAGVSGAGPETHDSGVTLASLLPRIATYRDKFYERLLAAAEGPYGERLRSEAQSLRQPFGGARHDLNSRLARLRAVQLQHVHLARLFAAMGNLEASSRQARIVPVASARLLSEISGRITVGRLALVRGDAAGAVEHAAQINDLLQRGIQCGALVDPWNILGFQGQFSLFPAMENSVRDHRVDVLIHLVRQTLGLCVRTAAEAAASGDEQSLEQVRARLGSVAGWWDRFATLDVSGVESVSGRESVAAADAVTGALSAWRQAGATGGDIAFWRKHVATFQSPRAYTLVIETLLDRRDFVAAMGLLIEWLSRGEQMPLAEGDYAWSRLAERWLRTLIAAPHDTSTPRALAAKFFDYLEANAGELWEVPRLAWGEDDSPESDADANDEDSPYEAAYEGMTYLDTTDDDVEGSTLEEGAHPSDYELELEATRLRQRIEFLHTLARLRTLAATDAAESARSSESRTPYDEMLAAQQSHAVGVQAGLLELLSALDRYRIPTPTTAHSSLVEYDRRRRIKEGLLTDVVAAAVENAAAVRWLRAATASSAAPGEASEGRPDDWQNAAIPLLQAILDVDRAAAVDQFAVLRPRLDQQAILYVPLARGGKPAEVVAAHCVKQFVVELLTILPRLGCLTESCRLIATAMAMERHRPAGDKAVTEFDRLFEIGYHALVESLIGSAAVWSPENTSRAVTDSAGDAELVECLQLLTEPLLRRWLEHSQSVRLSALEKVTEDKAWRTLVLFIERYGHDLFTQKFLNLGSLRAILDSGVDAYLRRLQDEPDAGPTLRLIDDLERGPSSGITRAGAVEQLQTVVEVIVENYVEYKEFNATTTQSDHGELLYMLIDMLRLKASYERVCWNIRPVVQAHDILMRRGRLAAAELWRRALAERTSEAADVQLAQLKQLTERYRLRLPTIAARLAERFVRPLAVDALRALVEPAVVEVRHGAAGEAFARLELEISEFAEQPIGSGLEVPPWLAALEEEAARVQRSLGRPEVDAEPLPHIARAPLALRDVLNQLRNWEGPAGGSPARDP